jgi:hypothetical protein
MPDQTGPRTTEGKAIASRNAIRHGLLSEDIVAPQEASTDWEEFRFDIMNALAPVAALESELAERVASLLWRLRRVPRAEAEQIRRPRGLAGILMLPDLATIQAFSRYEAHLNRQLVHTMHELEALQQRRRGRPAPLARLDVIVTPDELSAGQAIQLLEEKLPNEMP